MWRLQSNWQWSNTRQAHFEKEVSTELLKFKCSISCETKPYLKRCTMCFGYSQRNTVAQWNDTASFSCIPSNFSWTFCLWTWLCASRNSGHRTLSREYSSQDPCRRLSTFVSLPGRSQVCHAERQAWERLRKKLQSNRYITVTLGKWPGDR